jgi:ribosomal protein S18 acetylase RimI-like enzyme
MSTFPPKSTFRKISPWQWIRAAWEVCKSPECTASPSTFTSPLPRAAIRWVDEGRVALRPFDFDNDANAVASFQQETYSLNFEDFRYTDNFARAFRHDLRRAAWDDNNGLFVLQQHPSGEVGGFLWLIVYQNHWTGERYGYVNNLYLSPALRGRGLGRELMTQVDDFFRKRGVHSVRLSVTVSNEAATHLYESCGFRTTRWEMEKKI